MPSISHCLPSVILLGLATAGCGDGASESTNRSNGDPPIPVMPVDTAEPQVSIAELRRRLGANENAALRESAGRITHVALAESGVTDIGPLAGLPLKYLDVRGLPVADLGPLEGMPLESLFLEETQVSDVSVLKGMPLRQLYLNHTPVSDLSPLAGMRLQELNLFGTRVEDLSAVADLSVGTLWLRDTQVADLGPLEGMSLESLDIENTPVADLGALREMTSLRRLNIAGSTVSDLTPLADLRLERLIFTPSRITEGIDVVRRMESLRELDVEFREPERMKPAEFWRRYDAGEFEE
jgi:internalin A